MKSIKSLFSKCAALLATVVLTGLFMYAQRPPLSMQHAKARTWHTEVSTLKSNILFFGRASFPLNRLHFRARINGIRRFVLRLKFELKESLYYWLERFMSGNGLIAYIAPTDSLNTSTLAGQLTAYYQEHMEGIHSELEISLFDGPFDVNRNFTSLTDIEDELALDSVTMQPFLRQVVPTDTNTFNPVGSEIEPQARILKMRDYQGDLQFTDRTIQRTHLMWKSKMKQLAKGDSPDKTQTFIEYLFWEVIMKQAKLDLRKAIFQASFDNTGGYSPLKIMNGWEALIANEIIAGNITAVPMAAITSANVIPEVETVFDTVDTAVKSADDIIVSLDTATFTTYSRADSFSLGRTSNYDSSMMKIAGFPNATIIHEPHQTNTKVAVYRKSQAFLATHSGVVGAWEFQRYNLETKFILTGKVGLELQTVNPGGKKNIAIGQ